MPAAVPCCREGEIEGRPDLIRRPSPAPNRLRPMLRACSAVRGVKRCADEIGQLAWHSQDGPDHGKTSVCRPAAIPTLRRAERICGRIDDDAASHKWDTVPAATSAAMCDPHTTAAAPVSL